MREKGRQDITTFALTADVAEAHGAGSTGWLEREAAVKSERTSGHLGLRDVRSHKNETLWSVLVFG